MVERAVVRLSMASACLAFAARLHDDVELQHGGAMRMNKGTKDTDILFATGRMYVCMQLVYVSCQAIGCFRFNTRGRGWHLNYFAAYVAGAFT